MIAAILIALGIAAAPPLELDRLLEEVARRSPDVDVQRASVEVARRAVGAAGTWENPDLMIMVESVPLPGAAMGEEPPMVTYRLSQELNVFGRRGLTRRAARARVAREEATLRRAAWDARAQAVGLFYELWMNDEMQKVLNRQIEALGRMRESALARYRAGKMMGHHDVLRTESEIEAMKAERVSLEAERTAIVAMLNRLRGQPQTTEVGEPQRAPPRPLPPLASVLARTGRRPEVEAMRWMRAEMVARRDLARRMYWPMMMVEGEYEQRTDGMPDALGGAVVLSLPLWFWDAPQNEVAMANAMVRRSDRQLAAMASMTEADMRMAWSRALAAERRLDALEKAAIPKMRETVASAESAYSAGSADFLSLLDANLSLLELEAQRLEAVRALEVTRYELSRLVGVPLGEMSR